MAEYIVLEKSLTVRNSSAIGTRIATGVARLSYDVNISDTPTTAVITLTPKETVSVSATGGDGKARIEGVASSYDSKLRTILDGEWREFELLNSGTATSDIRPSRSGAINSGAITKTIAKTKVTQTIYADCSPRESSGGPFGTLIVDIGTSSDTAQITWRDRVNPGPHGITIAPITSYAITYNTDGGSQAPASQTKWYGEAIALSNVKPTKDGFKFMGWQASNGTVYQLGATYTANEPTTLTAIWEETKVSVKVKTGGEWKEGELRAKVNGRWVYADALYMRVNGVWIRIER